MKDHVELGRELDLFCQSPIVGKGLPLFTPRGAACLRAMRRFVEDEETARGYEFTMTPFMGSEDLYKVSGHWDLYRDIMFVLPPNSEEGKRLALRPMTCPFQFQVYKRKTHSYRELPVRYAETSTLFRNEPTGALHGLVRIRQFTLSEGHIICRPDQVEAEFIGALELVAFVTKAIGLSDISYRFSTRGDAPGGKYIDDPEAWESSQKTLRGLLDRQGLPYVEAPGEAAFYGPKLDIQGRDALGREETLFTLQLDFALAGRFEMSYMDEDGSEKRPMIIHRSSIGCYERTLALLLEKTEGRLPWWISPEQVRVISAVSDPNVKEQVDAGVEALAAELRARGIRVGIDTRNETLGRKVREARLLALPMMAVIGPRELAEGSVNLRFLEGDRALSVTQGEFLSACVRAQAERLLGFSEDYFA